MNKITEKRNISVDILRGMAMFMVVLGHTMTGCSSGTENSMVYNIIWSLQMPLFFIISGYATKYSKDIADTKELGTYILKRTLTYLFPLAVWTFLIRAMILGDTYFLDIKYLIFHMHRGYWYLFSLWTVSVIYGISQWLTFKFSRKKKNGQNIKQIILSLVFFGVGALILAGVGIIFGINLLCIKLTLYYIPFYLAGHLYGRLQDKILSLKHSTEAIEIIVAVSVITYTAFILNVNTVTLSDNLTSIIIRLTSSLIGCIALIGVSTKLISNGKISRFFSFIGVYSLEIYLSHYIILKAVKFNVTPLCTSFSGVILIFVTFTLTIGGAMLFSYIANTNKYLRLILFGKYK